MKVLYISTADYKYGAAKTQIDMIAKLKEEFGIIPIVLTKKHNEFNEWCDENGIENYSYWYRDIMAGSAYSFFILNVAKHCVKYILYLWGGITQRGILKCGINWDEIDLIHSNHIRIDIGAYISRKKGIPHIWHIKELNKGHVKIIHYKPNCYQYINNNADIHLAVTEQVKQFWCEAGLSESKVHVVYEGINTDKFIEKKVRKDNNLKLVCVGRIEKSKGQLQILKAILLLPEEIRKHVTIDFVGEAYPDYERILRIFIQKNHIEDRVHFQGYQKNIPMLLAEYDVGILSSKGDAFGTVVAEYMAAGLLAIATYSELFEDGKSGLMYNFDDIDKLADYLEKAYKNKEWREKMADEGKERINRMFTIEAHAQKVLLTYKELLKDGDCNA